MCGIIGRFYTWPDQREDLSAANLASITHRGNDGSGVYTNEHIQFGHVRLAIIDLTDAGRQPMSYDNGRYVVTFNGEVYNYLELKTELENAGEIFTSNSDTEVLLAAYKVWGIECLNRFRGMFAFALWDDREKSLFLARDRCGEKPLFYHKSDDCLSIASELKGLLLLIGGPPPELDPAVIDMYLHYQFVPEPFTLLKNIHKLPAAHYLLLTPDNWQTEPVRYWDVESVPNTIPQQKNQDEILFDIRNGLESAVKMTLRSDVPVAVALSGGLDSGAIAAFAQKNSSVPLHAFCVGYPGRPRYDERQQARKLAENLGMIVHEVELPVNSFVDFFPELVRVMDEPIADPAAFGHYSVPKAAADAGIKVLLSGIGGDEIFWGYPWTVNSVLVNQMRLDSNFKWLKLVGLDSYAAQKMLGAMANTSLVSGKLKRWAGLLQQLANDRSPPGQLHFYAGVPDFNDAFRLKKDIYGAAMRNLDADNPFKPTDIGLRTREEIPAAVIRMLFDTWLTSNCLSLGDRVSMGVGVESRLPFLDANLIDNVMALRAMSPDHELGSKVWLRAALKGVLPDDVLTRRKAGFQPPLREWLSGVVTQYGDILRDGQLVKSAVLNHNKIDYILHELPKRGWSGLFFTYKLVLLEMWYQKVVAV